MKIVCWRGGEGGGEGKSKMGTYSLTHTLTGRGLLPRGTESTFFFFFPSSTFLLFFTLSHPSLYLYTHSHGSRNRTSQVRFGRGCHQGHRYEQRKRERNHFTSKCLLRFHLCLFLYPHCNLMERKKETNCKDSLNGQQEHRARTNLTPDFHCRKRKISLIRLHSGQKSRTNSMLILQQPWSAQTRSNLGRNSKLLAARGTNRSTKLHTTFSQSTFLLPRGTPVPAAKVIVQISNERSFSILLNTQLS